MMMSETLTEQGFFVIGPFARTPEAIVAASDTNLHGAVLDVNLNGDLIYPVAELSNILGLEVWRATTIVQQKNENPLNETVEEIEWRPGRDQR